MSQLQKRQGNLHAASLLPSNSHLGQALPESPQNAVVLACPRDQVFSFLCPLGTPCSLLKSFLSSQGAKIIQSFMWYLNPRQVFDLSQGGPKEA